MGDGHRWSHFLQNLENPRDQLWKGISWECAQVHNAPWNFQRWRRCSGPGHCMWRCCGDWVQWQGHAWLPKDLCWQSEAEHRWDSGHKWHCQVVQDCLLCHGWPAGQIQLEKLVLTRLGRPGPWQDQEQHHTCFVWPAWKTEVGRLRRNVPRSSSSSSSSPQIGCMQNI